MTALRLVFAGSPNAAVPSLTALANSRHDVAAVITRADSPQGRARRITPTPVGATAEKLGLPTIRTDRLTPNATEQIASIGPDLGVIVAYGAIVRDPLLRTPRLGWINLHFSLLPRWRGAAPVQHAIIAGDELSGAAVFQLVPELDAGEVYGMISEPIGPTQNAGVLLDTLSRSGAELLLRVVDDLADGTAVAVAQEGEVTLAPKLTFEDGRIDWVQPAESVHARIRGVTPEPGAHTLHGDDRLKILESAVARTASRMPPGHLRLDGRRLLVGTATDPIELLAVQPAGRRAMSAPDWWRGRLADAGTVLS